MSLWIFGALCHRAARRAHPRVRFRAYSTHGGVTRRSYMDELARTLAAEPAKPDDPAPTRERILRAAAHLFRTRGYRGTTTRAISEIVGMLSGSLFHYFKSKEQMLFEVMHEGALSVCVRGDAVVAA